MNNSIQLNSDLLNTLKNSIPQFFEKDIYDDEGNLVKSGGFKIDRFLDELDSNNITKSYDNFRLEFTGKDYAIFQVERQSDAAFVPDTAHNSQPDNFDSGNIFITGDNLEALRILQKDFGGKIKMIYIDPPYNTGKKNGFVYNDKFEFDEETLKSVLGYSDAQVAKLKSMRGNNSHSAWLTFMYPRLKLAQKLLTCDGVIFISIDDNEQAELKLLMNEIFGECNFVAEFIVIRSEGGGLARQAVIGHDYLLCYAKSINEFVPLGRPKDIRGKIVLKDGEEYWIETDWLRKEFGKYGTCFYEEIERYYDDAKKREIDKGLGKGDYILIERGRRHIVGRYRKIADDTSKFYTILKYLNKDGVHDLDELGVGKLFNFPKPVKLIKELIYGATNKDKSAIILDFFAGSGATAHAVMQLNSEDGGNRKFIMVQIDEPVNKNSAAINAGYKTIDQITRERIKRAAKKIKSDHAENLPKNFDAGFKHYRLAKPDNYTART
ncbi:MAG: site-specific DNA-methyltransferase [Planctomycetaceae bacterium]|jgi:adenine-specific DNA-methyltransferase|nr:site-specific DNA-methyltransferase [Planctomycetaceae bacterium]